jgi:Mce-associated membrane protein
VRGDGPDPAKGDGMSTDALPATEEEPGVAPSVELVDGGGRSAPVRDPPEDAVVPSQDDVVPPEGDEVSPGTGEAPKRRRLLLPLLVAVSVLLAAAGVAFTVAARAAADDPAAANHALTDVGATADVTSAVTLALNRIFSYSYDKTAVTEQAARDVLRGPALVTYDRLFAQVEEKAPLQKLVLTTRVTSSAVQELTGDHARLLVFLDQSATRTDNNSSSSAAAQLSVTAERDGNTWKITDLTPR